LCKSVGSSYQPVTSSVYRLIVLPLCDDPEMSCQNGTDR